MSKTMPPDARPESAKSRDQKPSDATMQALCNECGNVRTAKAIYFGSDGRYDRKVKCDACGRATTHFPVPMESRSDRRERRNAEVNEQARLAVQFQESLAMLDQLGIRFELVETDEWFAKVWRERGRGSQTCFIDLAADLTLAEQVS